MSAVLRYFGPAWSSSVRSGWRRPTNPRIWSWWVMGKTARSRKRSMRFPVRARVARPVSRSSSSVTPRRAQVVHHGGPPGGCVPGGDVRVVAPSGEAVVEVVPGPRGVDVGGVEVHGHGVDLHEPGRVGDGVVPGGGPGDHPLDLGVGGLQHAHGLPVQRGREQVGVNVVRVVDARSRHRRHLRRAVRRGQSGRGPPGRCRRRVATIRPPRPPSAPRQGRRPARRGRRRRAVRVGGR